jgi:hypothetical protein
MVRRTNSGGILLKLSAISQKSYQLSAISCQPEELSAISFQLSARKAISRQLSAVSCQQSASQPLREPVIFCTPVGPFRK